MLARSYTSNPEVYEYLTTALVSWPDALLRAHEDLRNHALLGNVTMVRYLLHLGVLVQIPLQFKTPLLMACRGSHKDVVDLLLEHGSDPNFVAQKLYPLFPLHESATASNLSLVRKLLDHGALVNQASNPPRQLAALWWAFAREHTVMIKLLLERGASFGGGQDDFRGKGWIGKSLADMTYHLGYDSMVEILRQYGFVPGDPLPRSLRNTGGWQAWRDSKDIISSRS